MNAVPPTFTPANPADPDLAPVSFERTAMRWAALVEAADLVAILAGIDGEDGFGTADFLTMLCDAEAWRRERAEHAVADLLAIMEPGLSALLAVNARGADTQPAAAALWLEFVAARDAVLTLLAAGGAQLAERGA